MSTKTPRNPETPTNPEAPEPKQELETLETQVTWDRRKFEALLKNSTLKNWLDKILKKESASIISTFESQYKENENKWLSIESWTRLIAKTDPGLLWFVCWDLWLPYEELAVRWMKNTKFSQLTYEQKMNFISLYNTLRTYNFNISRVKPKDFINKYKSLAAGNLRIITEKFNKRVSDNENIVWLVDLKKVLKNQYWLTDAETKKVGEYVELVQKHPEYVWWFSEISKIQQAGWFPWKSFFECVKWAIIVWGAVWWISQFKWCFSLQPTVQPAETKIYWDRTEITDFEETFKIMSAVSKTTSHERPIHEDGLGHIDLWWSVWVKPLELGWNWFSDLVNMTWLENRDMVMKINCDNYYTFDFKWVRCFVEKQNWIRMVRLTWVKKPEVITNVTNVEILESHREKIINLKKFDDFEIRAQETLRKEANEEAKKPEKIREAEESLGNQILRIFQSNWVKNSDVCVDWKDIQGITIEYESEQIEPPQPTRNNEPHRPNRGDNNWRYFDPENKKTLIK